MRATQLLASHPAIWREDGRTEILCPHGVGHPSQMLSRGKWEDWMSTHGCDGCCSSDDWRQAETLHLLRREKAAEKRLKAHSDTRASLTRGKPDENR